MGVKRIDTVAKSMILGFARKKTGFPYVGIPMGKLMTNHWMEWGTLFSDKTIWHVILNVYIYIICI